MLIFIKIIFTFIIGLFFIKISKLIAIKLDIVDRPNATLKIHTKCTPYLGGLGIIVTFFTSFFIYNDFGYSIKYTVELITFLIIFILGVLDDRFNISIKSRLLVQFLVSILLISIGDVLNLTGIYGVDILMTIFGVVFIINAMNILDILDGLAAGITSIILGTFVFINSMIIGNEFYIFISIIYIVTLISFLVYNFNPASIFMGDAGSTVLGMFIVIVFINTYNNTPDISFKFASFIAISIPIFELIYVSILRLRKGKNPMCGSKDHFAIRKIFLGHSIKESVMLTYGITFMTSLVVYITIGLTLDKLLVILFGVFISFLIFGYILAKVKVD